MRTHKVNVSFLEDYGYDKSGEYLIFIRPVWSPLYRACTIPEIYYHEPDTLAKLMDILSGITRYRKKDIHYLHPGIDPFDVVNRFDAIGVKAIFIDDGSLDVDAYGWPQQAILN